MNTGHIIAAIVGIGIAIQVAIVGKSASEINPLSVSLALQASGLGVATIWAIRSGTLGDALNITGHWWWLPLGAGGWAVVAALGFSANRIGIASTLAISIGAQLFVAVVVDAIRNSELTPSAIVGVLLIVIGAVFVNL